MTTQNLSSLMIENALDSIVKITGLTKEFLKSNPVNEWVEQLKNNEVKDEE